MRLAVTGTRLLLGLSFVVFGLNGFYRFVPVPEMTGDAEHFLGILISSGWIYVVKGVEIAGGILLLANYRVPLGVGLLGPIVVNILLFHLLLDPERLPLTVPMTLTWAFLLWAYWKPFRSVVEADPKGVGSNEEGP